jgi:glycosyltransferase involved in cell wall biosynthesis
MKYSVVIPVYRNEPTLLDLLRQLEDACPAYVGSIEVVFVIDGSPDNSYALLRTELPRMGFPSQLVSLSRNFGSFAAVRAGLSLARGDSIAVLAADLQQPVTSVPQFFDALDRGCDVVVGQRSSRDDPWMSRVAAEIFWSVYRRFIQPEMPVGGVDSFACTRRVRDILVALPEANSTLVGLLLWVGFHREVLSYPRARRPSGRSGWTLGRKLRYALDSAFAFTDLPLTMMVTAGTIGVGGAIVAAIVVLVAWASGAIDVRGYTPLMLAVLFSLSTMLLALGIVGGYVWRIFENTKGRPVHLIQSVEQIDAAIPAAASMPRR